MTKRNEVAAYFHRRMCEDPRFGYTQGAGRWGVGPTEVWTYEGVTGRFLVGDRDCSSSVIDCWQEALRGSRYEGALGGATYTGDMRRVFVGSGLFEWKPRGSGYIAQTGDVYLSEAHHTAMCQSAIPDILSEFLLNEWGGITGGQVGDQTGAESIVRAYWDFPWDGTLAYNHKADDERDDMTPEQATQLQFIYDHLHWDEKTHYSDLGNLVAEFPIEYETVDEKGEKSPLVQPLGKRLGYIDQRTHVLELNLKQIEDNQAAIMEILEEIQRELNNYRYTTY